MEIRTNTSGQNYYTAAPFITNMLFVEDSCKFSENDMLCQWFELPPGTSLKTASGQTILIMNLGHRNRNKGPDIQNAVIFIEGAIVHGDVECHLRENSWYSHGHETDDNYDNVILHLVHETCYYKQHPIEHTVVMPQIMAVGCSLNSMNISKKHQDYLMNLGEQRWLKKVEKSKENTIMSDLGNILGKGGNEKNFKKLVKHIDISQLTLLKHEAHIHYIRQIVLDLEISWEGCGIRPAHRPEKRYLLLIELLHFLYRMDEYFEDPHSFYKLLKKKCVQGGASILMECCVNIFYPRFARKALKMNKLEIYSEWKNLWMEMKLAAPYGKFSRRFGNIIPLQTLKQIPIAQGLIMLDSLFCDSGHCGVCPLKDTDKLSSRN